MEETRAFIVRSIRDIATVGGLLGLINWGVAPGDFGWVNLNPSPWLLLPFLIGARYGVVSGLVSGVASCLVIAAVNAGHDLHQIREFLQLHPYFFSALSLSGFLAGEGGRVLRQENTRLHRSYKTLGDKQERTEAELELVRETRHQLQQHLALHNATLAGLDDELRKLMTGPPGSMMDSLLGLLHKQALITSAALYRRVGDDLLRIAALHPTAPLKEELTLDTVPLARRALEEHAIASAKSALETTPDQPFLVAIPFRQDDGEGVLLVQDMPLATFGWQHLARIELILVWVFSLLRARKQMSSPGKLVDQNTFKAALDQALLTEQMHHLPSMVVKILVDDEAELRNMLRQVPATALATRLTAPNGAAVLLPFAGEMEAASLYNEWHKPDAAWRITRYPVVDTASTSDFWVHVLKP